MILLVIPQNLYENDIIEFKKNKLSLYGFESVEEFISESIAEYLNSPKKEQKYIDIFDEYAKEFLGSD